MRPPINRPWRCGKVKVWPPSKPRQAAGLPKLRNDRCRVGLGRSGEPREICIRRGHLITSARQLWALFVPATRIGYSITFTATRRADGASCSVNGARRIGVDDALKTLPSRSNYDRYAFRRTSAGPIENRACRGQCKSARDVGAAPRTNACCRTSVFFLWKG